MKIPESAGGEKDNADGPTPTHAPRSKEAKGTKAPQRGADVQRAPHEEHRQVSARQRQQRQHGCRRRNPSRPAAPISGQGGADEHHERGDHRRHEIKQHGPYPGDDLRHRVEERVRGPKRIERQRPPVQHHVARTHRLTLEHDRGTVGVTHCGVNRRGAQHRDQRRKPDRQEGAAEDQDARALGRRPPRPGRGGLRSENSGRSRP